MNVTRSGYVNRAVALTLLFVLISTVSAQTTERGPYWNRVTNDDGTVSLEVSELMNYNNGTDYVPINITLIQDCEQGYDYCVEAGVYQAQFKQSSSGTEIATYTFNDSSVSYTPYKLQYTGNNKQSLISNSQNVIGFAEDNKFTYPAIYGSGFNLSFTYQATRLKEELIIEDEDDLPEPSNKLGNDPQLSLEFKIRMDNLDAENHGSKVKWNKVSDFVVDGRVDFKDSEGNILFFLPQAYAIDSAGERVDISYEFKKAGVNLFVSMKTPYSWLEDDDREYPVYIDPTTALSSSASSAASKNDNADTNFGGQNYIAVGKSQSTLGEIRTFIMFNVSQIPADVEIDSANLYLWLYEDNTESNSQVINAHRVTSYWIEDEVTWNDRATGVAWISDGGDFDASIADSTTISADPSDAWYSWDLTALTTTWYNGSYDNFGIVLKKQETKQWEHRFYSDEFTADPGLAPKLEVNYSIIEEIEDADITIPEVSLIYPESGTYGAQVTALNYTASDVNLESCWCSTDNGATNITMTCGQNATGLDSVDGSNIWMVWANDSTGNQNSSSVTFIVDTTAPHITIDSPNGTYNTSTMDLNYTVTDLQEVNCTYNVSSLVNDSVVSDTALEGCNNITFNVTDGNYTLYLTAEDAVGNLANQFVNFTVLLPVNTTDATNTTNTTNTTDTSTPPPADSSNNNNRNDNAVEENDTVEEEDEVDDAVCVEDWSCSDWGNCIAGVQIRDCTEANSCGTTLDNPVEVQECKIDHCIDNIQNSDEEGVDCGGDDCDACEQESGFYRLTGALLEIPDVAVSKSGAAYVSILLVGLCGMYITINSYRKLPKHKRKLRSQMPFRRGKVIDFSNSKRRRVDNWKRNLHRKFKERLA